MSQKDPPDNDDEDIEFASLSLEAPVGVAMSIPELLDGSLREISAVLMTKFNYVFEDAKHMDENDTASGYWLFGFFAALHSVRNLYPRETDTKQ